MQQDSLSSQNSTETELMNAPLVEAWLDIRWELKQIGPSQLSRDKLFPFALGRFQELVQSKYPLVAPLDASAAPNDMLPHVVRYQFRGGENEWPLLQLGPGIATVNFTDPYTWNDFKDAAMYLRAKLIEAYGGESVLNVTKVTLTYRNVENFSYSTDSLIHFLESRLNTALDLPPEVPGDASTSAIPTSANILLSFDLDKPEGVGALRIATGFKREGNEVKKDVEAIIWQLGVSSEKNNVPSFGQDVAFEQWLEEAHNVIHGWFFSMVQGPLLAKYTGEQ